MSRLQSSAISVDLYWTPSLLLVQRSPPVYISVNTLFSKDRVVVVASPGDNECYLVIETPETVLPGDKDT